MTERMTDERLAEINRIMSGYAVRDSYEDELVRALKAEREHWEAKLAQVEWQPIDTAPKDGTVVLVSNGKHVWLSSRKITRQNSGGMPTVGRDWSAGYLGQDTAYPTRWMPLPEPPQAMEQDD